MIESVFGKIIEKNPTFCVLDCHGIGIGLHISLNTFQFLERQDTAEAVKLQSYLHVREDSLQLYGFSNVAEKGFFQLLISISGVGPKLALSVLSGSSPEDLRSAIATENVGMLTRIPGVGKKTAQRLILELREKISKLPATSEVAKFASAMPKEREKAAQAVSALVELGYKPADAQRAIDKVIEEHGDEVAVEALIRLSFRKI